MQKKFLYITDIHNKSERDNPKGRTDNYYKSILAKQEEIGQIIEVSKPDVLLFGGDLFDKFDAPMSLVNDVVSIWRTYKVPTIIGVIGSHDYSGYQIKTLRRTALGNFIAHDLMQIVGNGKDQFPKELRVPISQTASVLITGTPHSYSLASAPGNFFTAVDKNSGSYVIQLVHGDLFHKTVQWQHQTIQSAHPFIHADLVLSGHIHSGWPSPIPIFNDNSITQKTYYVNPGSIGRTAISQIRPIRCFEFTVDDKYNMEFSFIDLKNVIEYPFIEKSEEIEASPGNDFSNLMQMISDLKLKPIEFKSRIPEIVESLYGVDFEEKEALMENVLSLFENTNGVKK